MAYNPLDPAVIAGFTLLVFDVLPAYEGDPNQVVAWLRQSGLSDTHYGEGCGIALDIPNVSDATYDVSNYSVSFNPNSISKSDTISIKEPNYNYNENEVGLFPNTQYGARAQFFWNPLKFILVDGILVPFEENFSDIRLDIIKILAEDEDFLREEVVADDYLPLIAPTTFQGTPYFIHETTPISKPIYIVSLSFLENGASFMLTHNIDINLVKSGGPNIPIKGSIINDPAITKELGDEIYGSVIFPTASLAVDGTDGSLSFLITNPRIGYSGYVHMWRWDPISRTLKDEFTGVVTAFSLNNHIYSFELMSINSDFFDKQVPSTSTLDMGLTGGLEGDALPLARHYGFNLNVRCPLVEYFDQGEVASDYYKYFVTYGRARVFNVRNSNKWVPPTSYPAGGEWALGYDSIRDYTYIEFPSRQNEGGPGNFTPVTCDFEAQRVAYKNLLSESNDFSNNAWNRNFTTPERAPGTGKYINDYEVLTKPLVGPSPDGRFDSSWIRKNKSGSVYIQHVVSIPSTATNGFFAYVIVKEAAPKNLQYLTWNNITPLFETTLHPPNGVQDFVQVHIGQGATINTTFYNNANTTHGVYDLGDDWTLIYVKQNESLAAGSYRMAIEFKLFHVDLIMWGAYCAVSTSTTVAEDLELHPLELMNNGYASTRNFALNIKELLSASIYGYVQDQIDDESFFRVGGQQFLRNMYCDGAVTEFDSGKLTLDDLLMPLNCRLERNGIFRTWYLHSDIVSATAPTYSFGMGDDRGLGNITGDISFTHKNSSDYPNSVVFETVPIRDEAGTLTGYKRKRVRKEFRDIEYGQQRTISNKFVSLERTADILCSNVRLKLAYTLYFVNFSTDDPVAWNIELDDLVKLYVPQYDLNGATYEVTSIVKHLSTCDITARPYLAFTYDYIGDYPLSKTKDLVYDSENKSNSSSGNAVTVRDYNEAGVDVGAPPGGDGSGSRIVFRRTYNSILGQELAVQFADGSSAVIARSGTGSPATLQYTSIAEYLPYTDNNMLFHDGITADEIGYMRLSLSYPAVITNELKPQFFYRGVEQEVEVINRTAPNGTEYGKVQLISSSSIVRVPLDYEGTPVVAKYETPTDFSGLAVFSVTIAGSNNIHMYKPTSIHYRTIGMGYNPSLARTKVVSSVPYLYILCYTSYEDSDFIDNLKVRKYSQHGHPLEEFDLPMYNDNTWTNYPNFYHNSPRAPVSSYTPAMDIEPGGTPWVAFTDDNKRSWLIHLTGGTVNEIFEITSVTQSLDITALAYDSDNNEIHVCCAFSGYTRIYLFNTSGEGLNTLTYTILGSVASYRYSSEYQAFCATFYSDAQDLTSTPYGVSIITTRGQEYDWGDDGATWGSPPNFTFRNFSNPTLNRVKDFFRADDGGFYIIYTESSVLKMGRISESLFMSNMNLDGLLTNIIICDVASTVSNGVRCYGDLISSRPIPYTQLAP